MELAGSNPRLLAASAHARVSAARDVRLSTVEKSLGPVRWHTSFVLKHNLLPPGKPLFPLDAATVHLFLADLSLRKANKSSTSNAISALAWFSRFLGESSSALDAAPNRMIAAGDRRTRLSAQGLRRPNPDHVPSSDGLLT